MADGASGSADKSVQVKLVLLGMSWSYLVGCVFRHIFAHSSWPSLGEAAVGKSSVVLRFVGFYNVDIFPASKPFTQGFQRVSTQQRTNNWCCFLDAKMSPRRPYSEI
jgi:Na+/phosphate symporter